jgi:putative endonuclease
VQERIFFVYILASKPRGTLYVGVTNDIARRVWEHRSKAVAGFTRTHNVTHLVWYEAYPTAESAIAQEKRLKKWRRQWKIELIKTTNLHWADLYETLQPS